MICGAGICGVSAAYFLARAGARNILLVDERPPLTLTSDRSTECYRNWWPDPAILALMNRSIELLEDLARGCGNCFHLNHRGYLYVTGDRARLDSIAGASERISRLGGGPLRIHKESTRSYRPTVALGDPLADGADLLLGGEAIREHFPYLSPDAVAALHVRRAGWLSAQQLGMYMLEQARSMGVKVETGHIAAIGSLAGHVAEVQLTGGERVQCSAFIDAAGPYLNQVAALLGLELPIHTELHMKAVFKDSLGIVGRDAPLLIWDDPQVLPWSEEERSLLDSDLDSRWLTGVLPAGAHTRPEGPQESSSILMLWDYRANILEPVFPPPLDGQYPELALRGLSTMLPGLRAYVGRASRPQVDGGYYVKTRENRLLAGPLPLSGAYVLGAVSGYGIMAACAAGELVAAHVLGSSLPNYAPAFLLSRYADPSYEKSVSEFVNSGQL